MALVFNGLEALAAAMGGGDTTSLNTILPDPCQMDSAGNLANELECAQLSIARRDEVESSNVFQSDIFKTALTSVASVLTGGTSAITGAIATASRDEQFTLEELGAIAGKTALSALGGEVLSTIEVEGGFMFEDLFSGVGDFFSDFSLSDYLPSSETFSTLAQIATPIAGALLAPAPATNVMNRPATPIYQTTGPVATPTMGGSVMVPALGGAVSAMRAVLMPILVKIAAKLGLRTVPSLSKAMTYIRNLGKAQLAPAAIAAVLGITIDELARLIVADKHRKRRRMNPANSKALRRAARRIESFHRLCGRTDMLRSRGRRRTSSGACGTCRKRPCRC